MSAALLDLTIFVATIDPRLVGTLPFLAQLPDRESAAWARTPDILGLTLKVAPLPPGAGGHFNPSTRSLTMSEALLDEDLRVVAVGLVHEFQHAGDFGLVAAGLLDRDCIELEVRAFEAQAKVTRAFWPGELPTGADWENGLAMAVQAYERDGRDGLRAMIRSVPAYQSERCDIATSSLTVPDASRVSARLQPAGGSSISPLPTSSRSPHHGIMRRR